MTKIIKRDGRLVDFDSSKIAAAVCAAMAETETGIDIHLANRITDAVVNAVSGKTLGVEDIQDLVESQLMSSDRKDVAKKFILYRAERTKQRDLKSDVMRRVYEKTNGTSIENSNANVDEATFGGRRNEASNALQKNIALEMTMSREVSDAHKDGLIYEHDLDFLNVGAHNCLFIDFEHIFSNGFATRNCDVRPPTSLSTACQLVAVAFQLQSQCQYGGVGSVHLDTDLAPYVKLSFYRHYCDGLNYLLAERDDLKTEQFRRVIKSELPHIDNPVFDIFPKKVKEYAMEMLEREGRQAAQGLFHNLGTLESRAGSQVPFSSQNYGRDTSPEGRLVNKWLLEASLDGIGKHHKTPIFPISIFSYKKGVNADPGDPNYDLKQLAIKSLSRRIYPNFCNGDWSEAHEDPDDPDTIFSTMG